MRNGRNDAWNCVKGSSSIKLTQICKENQEGNVLHICRYDVTHAQFKPL